MDRNEITLLRQKLAQDGHSCTKARELTFKLLQSPTPLSMRELIAKANGTVDRVSVYRNVELFEKLGIVHRIYIGWKYKLELSDEFTGHHHHLCCLNCGTIIDIEDEKHIDKFITEVAAKFGFLPQRHQFEVEGYCARCR